MASTKLGICEKKQYEHSRPHQQIFECSQTMPPFPCVRWHELEVFDGDREDGMYDDRERESHD